MENEDSLGEEEEDEEDLNPEADDKPLETGRLYWHKGVKFVSFEEKEVGREKKAEGDVKARLTIRFKTQLDDNDAKLFATVLQRKDPGKTVVTLRDIKDSALFCSMVDIPPFFIRFFHTAAVDRLLRALIVYMQYYLQVWGEMLIRQEELKRKIRHPNSPVERVLKRNLTELRYILSREYCTIVMGEGGTKKYHHMGGHHHNKSMTNKDLIVHEMLFSFATKVVCTAIHSDFENLIQAEMRRLFKAEETGHTIFSVFGPDEISIFDPPFFMTGNPPRAPLLRELFRPRRNPIINYIGLDLLPQDNSVPERLHVLEAAYLLPEEKLVESNVKLGILGLPRGDYDESFSMKKLGVTKGHGSRMKMVAIQESQMSIDEGKQAAREFVVPRWKSYESFQIDPEDLRLSTPQPEDQAQIKAWLNYRLKSSRFQHKAFNAEENEFYSFM